MNANEPYKLQAKALAAFLLHHHQAPIRHNRALHAIAAAYGFNNWNELCASSDSTRVAIASKLRVYLAQVHHIKLTDEEAQRALDEAQHAALGLGS